jgi:hypothetical protein
MHFVLLEMTTQEGMLHDNNNFLDSFWKKKRIAISVGGHDRGGVPLWSDKVAGCIPPSLVWLRFFGGEKRCSGLLCCRN